MPLSTSKTYSNAYVPELQTKNAVLLETTHAIFSNQETDYLGLADQLAQRSHRGTERLADAVINSGLTISHEKSHLK